jgi:DNA-binding LacI/PurR family transcriptional regulator
MKRMNKVRLKDIARLSNVSSATVTRVVNNSGYVAKEKRKIVEAVIKQMGYVPPKAARKTVPVRMIGHIVQTAETNLLFARLSDSINRVAMERGYYVVTVNVSTRDNATTIMDIIKNLTQCEQVQGIILDSLGDIIDFMSIRDFIVNQSIPLVMVERVADIYGINKVLINAKEGMFTAVRYLVKHGHRNILFMGEENPLREVEVSRLEGFRAAAQALGCAESVSFLPCTEYGIEPGYRAISEYLRHKMLPTAIIGADSI